MNFIFFNENFSIICFRCWVLGFFFFFFGVLCDVGNRGCVLDYGIEVGLIRGVWELLADECVEGRQCSVAGG
jgi:hypothetical protein